MEKHVEALWNRVAEYIIDTEDIESAREIKKRIDRLIADHTKLFENW